MPKFALKKIEAVVGKQDFYKLVRDDVCFFDDFEQEVQKNKKHKNELGSIYCYMEQVANGESGYLIPTGSPGTLADHLDKLLSNPSLRNRMGEKGYERAERFSVETMLDEFDSLYRELLQGTDKHNDLLDHN